MFHNRQKAIDHAMWLNFKYRIAVADGEILRYILKTKVPLDKLIRHELALRGYDENRRWCEFDFHTAREIWLNE